MAKKTSCPRRRASSNPGAHPLGSRLRGNDTTPQGPHGLAVYLRNGHPSASIVFLAAAARCKRWRGWAMMVGGDGEGCRAGKRRTMRTATLGKRLLAAVLGMGLVLWLAVVSGWAGAQEALDAFTRQDYATAFRELQPLAQHGDAAAQSLLGFLYAHGYGVAQDYGQAVQWFRRAADQGHPRAQFYLGGLYSAGHGVPQDAVQAAQWYRRAADQGEPRAQLGLGLLYAKGQGVPQDAAQAAQWIRRAAEQGLAAAQFSLGVLYAEGQGVPQDAHQAAQWYRRAADQGDAAAQYNLGQLYGLGHGVPQDLLQAHLWLTLAATGLPAGPQRSM